MNRGHAEGSNVSIDPFGFTPKGIALVGCEVFAGAIGSMELHASLRDRSRHLHRTSRRRSKPCYRFSHQPHPSQDAPRFGWNEQDGAQPTTGSACKYDLWRTRTDCGCCISRKISA